MCIIFNELCIWEQGRINYYYNRDFSLLCNCALFQKCKSSFNYFLLLSSSSELLVTLITALFIFGSDLQHFISCLCSLFVSAIALIDNIHAHMAVQRIVIVV